MAKKKNKLDLDDNLDDFDFGDDDFESLLMDEDDSKSRKPEGLSRVASSFKKNMTSLDTYKDPQELKRLASKALPKELNSEINDFKGVYDSVTETISKETSEIKKQVADVASNMNKLLPSEGKIRSLFDKTLGKLLPNLETEYERRRSEEEERTEAINNSIAAAIGDNAKLDEIRNAANQALEDRRTASTNTLLKDIVENTRISKDLDIQITARFQKKSLELQYRQVYILKDLLENARSSALKQDSQLQAIVKNTSLPDIVKAKQTELFAAETLKTFRNNVTTKLFKESNIYNIIKKNLTNKITNFTEDIKSNLESITDATSGLIDGKEMMESMGVSRSDMIGSTIAEGLRDNFVSRLFGKVYKTNLGKKIINTGKMLHHDPSSFFRERIKDGESTGILGKFKNKVFGTLADLTDVRFNSDAIDVRKEDLNSASVFDGRTKLSINNIIPSYLRKIHAEIYSVRMGIKDQDVTKYELIYDVNRESFSKRGSLAKNLQYRAKEMLASSTKYDREYISKVFKEAGANENLSRKISKQALESSVNSNKNGIHLFKDKSFLNNFSKEEQAYIKKAISHIEKNPSLMNDILYSTVSLRGNISSFNPVIEELSKSGYSNDLAKLGLLKYDKNSQTYVGDNRNISKFFLNSYVNNSNGLVADLSKEDFERELKRINNLPNKYEKEKAIKNLYEKYKDYFEQNPEELERIQKKLANNKPLTVSDIKTSFKNTYNKIKNISKDDIISFANNSKSSFINNFNKTKNYIEETSFYNDTKNKINAIDEETDKISIVRKSKNKIKDFISKITNKDNLNKFYNDAKVKIEKAYKDVKDPVERKKLIDQAKQDIIVSAERVKTEEGRKEILNNIENKAKITKDFLKQKTKEIKDEIKNDPYLQEKLAKIKNNEKVQTLYSKASNYIENSEQVQYLKDKVSDIKKSEEYTKAKRNLDLAIEYSKSVLSAADLGDKKAVKEIIKKVQSISPEAADTEIFKETVSNAKALIKAKESILINQEKELAIQALSKDSPEEKKKGILSFLINTAKMGYNLLPIGATARLIGRGMWAFTKFGWKTEWKLYSGLVKKILNLGRLALPRTVRQALSVILPKKYRDKFIGTKDQSYVGYAKKIGTGLYNIGRFGYKVGKFGVKYPIMGLANLSSWAGNKIGNLLFGTRGYSESINEDYNENNTDLQEESFTSKMLNKAKVAKTNIADKAKSIIRRNKEKKLEESLTANNKESRKKKMSSREKIINGKKASELNKTKDKDKKDGGGLLTTILGSLLGVLGTLGTAAGHLVKFFIGGGLTNLFKNIGGMIAGAISGVGSGVMKAGSWIADKAAGAVKGVKNLVSGAGSKISEYLSKLKGVKGAVKEKIIKRIGPKKGLSLAGKLIGKIAGRLLPGIGTALLLYDISCVGYYMTKGLDFKSAACKAIIGFDPWNDEEPILDENGRPIKPDEEEPIVEESNSSNEDSLKDNYASETGILNTESKSSDNTSNTSIMKSSDSSNVVLDTSRLESLHYEALKIHSNILQENKETNNKLDSIIRILTNTHEEVKTNTRISVEKEKKKSEDNKNVNGSNKNVVNNTKANINNENSYSYDQIPSPIINIKREYYGLNK